MELKPTRQGIEVRQGESFWDMGIRASSEKANGSEWIGSVQDGGGKIIL